MNIGVCVIHKDNEIENSFSNMQAQGFTHCQLLSWNYLLWNDREAEIIDHCRKKYNITITAFWCGWRGPTVWNFYDGQETLGLVPVTYRYARMNDLINGSDFAKKSA